MKVVNIPIGSLREAPWNPNQMAPKMLARLIESISLFGFVVNLVVRRLVDGTFEVLSGNQRLLAAIASNLGEVPCLVVDVDDARARLLAQALNRIQGEDDLGLKAELVRFTLESISQTEILSVLPETAESLKAFASLGEIDIAEHLRAWQKAQSARLKHLTFQLPPSQLEVIEEALEQVNAGTSSDDSNPNRRGNALYAVCRAYLELLEGETLNELPCPVCRNPLRLSPAKSRKAKKPKVFLMLACTVDGRHFRGFINDREFVGRVIEKAESLSKSSDGEV